MRHEGNGWSFCIKALEKGDKVYFCLQQQIERAVTVAPSLILSCDGTAEWKGKPELLG